MDLDLVGPGVIAICHEFDDSNSRIVDYLSGVVVEEATPKRKLDFRLSRGVVTIHNCLTGFLKCPGVGAAVEWKGAPQPLWRRRCNFPLNSGPRPIRES